MKVRILENSIRFRVSQNELSYLSKGEPVSSETVFPSNILKVVIRPSEKQNIEIDFKAETIEVSVPQHSLIDLDRSNKVGLSERIVCNEEILEVVFEKDFKCLTDRGEDESNLFENPRVEH